MLTLCNWLQHSGWVITIGESGWLYTSFEVLHYLSLFLLVGTSTVIDFRLLGLSNDPGTKGQSALDLLPLMWAGLILALISGFVMFATEAQNYFLDPLFRIKIVALVLAIALAIVVQRNMRKWIQALRTPALAKLTASVSLTLWLGVIVASVGLAIYTGL